MINLQSPLRYSMAAAALTLLSLAACGQPAPTANDTLFLTWHGDPTTTMVAQWLELGQLPEAMPDSSDNAAFATPRLTRPITIDGRGDDWGVAGLRLDYLETPKGKRPNPDGFLVTAKLGWTEEGLAVLASVRDDQATESEKDNSLWAADSLEIFLGEGVGKSRAMQIVITPGIDPQHPAVRTMTFALAKKGMPQDIEVQAAAIKTDTGYTVEALVPWSNLDAEPQTGETFAFQLIVNDVDGEFAKEQLAWFPSSRAYKDRSAVHTIRLAEAPNTVVRAVLRPRFDEALGRLVVEIDGEPRLVGESVTLRSGDQVIGTARFERILGFASAVIELPLADDGYATRFDAASLHLEDGQVIGRAAFPHNTWRRPAEAITVERLGGGAAEAAALTSEVLPFGRTGWFVHRVSMTGLTPDTDYRLIVPGHDRPVLFRTLPTTLEKPMVFAEGGDVGTSYAVGQLHDQAAAWSPMFGLVGGDCAYGNGINPKAWRNYLKLWHDHMVTPDGRSIPMLASIGNHEVAGSFDQPKIKAPFFNALFGPLFSESPGHYQTVDAGNYLTLFLLDSGHTAKHDGSQTQWLADALEQRPDVTHRFAAYHVPAYPSHRSFDGSRSAQARLHWVPLFEKHRIDAAFEHHDHTYKRTHLLLNDQPHPDGILYLGDGAWGRTPRTAHPERPYLAVAKSVRNVIRVTLNPDGTQSYLAVDEHGEVVDQYPQEDPP